MSLAQWPQMLLFMALILVVCVFIVTAAGHFPARFRDTKLRTPTGATIIWGSILVVGVSAPLAIYFALAALPWYAAVIGGGLMALLAPLLVQPLPDRVVDSRAALIGLSGAALALDLAALKLLA